MKNTRNLILCRSDLGDGGWSLHAPLESEEDDYQGPELLLHGSAEWDHASGDWNRPNAADYKRAADRLAEVAR